MIPFYPVKPIRGGRPLDGLYKQLAADPEWTCQAKLNGQRALWDGHTLWSRDGNGMHVPRVTARLIKCANLITLDGEVTGTGEHAVYHVFDLPDVNIALSNRIALMHRFEREEALSGVVRLCPLNVTWDEVECAGWEGVVFKKLSSPYPKADRPDVETPRWVKYRKEWL